MRFKFFTIPVFNDDPATRHLNAFLAAHVVVQVERAFIQVPGGAAWSFLHHPSLDSGEAGKATSSASKWRIDDREVLSPEDFAVYAKPRELRKTRADTLRVPADTLFTKLPFRAADLARFPAVGESSPGVYFPRGSNVGVERP